MKIILAFIIVIGFGYIGYGFYSHLKRRKDFFSKFYLFLNKINADIKFTQSKLKDIFSVEENFVDSTLFSISKNYLAYLQDNKVELNEDMLFKNINIFKKEEKKDIYLIFSCLGKLDVENQSDLLNTYKVKINSYSKDALEQYKKFGSLSIKLGVLFGLVIAILLI